MPLMNINGQALCSVCELDKETARLEAEVNDNINREKKEEKMHMLDKHSLIQDMTIRNSSFDSYLDLGDEERVNKQKAIMFAEQYAQGQQFNLWISSPKTGVGKSHLAMAILKQLSSPSASCLFIDIDEMLRKIRGSFNNKESKFTEEYFIDLCVKADFLVLDDLGAETGDIETGKRASDYTSKVLRAIVNGRQSKSTIITTNLSTKALSSVYDPKVISRMLRRVESIVFKEAMDKRLSKLDF